MLIDVDEFGVTIERCNRKKGWALKVFRVRKDGHYGHGQKITVLFAIEPGDPTLPPHVYDSIQWPQRWIKCVRNIGTSTNTFRDFCEYICNDIEVNGIPGTDDQRIFIWDNLSTAPRMSMRRSLHARILVVFTLSQGRHTTPNSDQSSKRSATSHSKSSSKLSRIGTLQRWSSKSWLLP